MKKAIYVAIAAAIAFQAGQAFACTNGDRNQPNVNSKKVAVEKNRKSTQTPVATGRQTQTGKAND